MTLIRLHAARSDLFAYLRLSLSFSPGLFLCLYFSVCMSVTSSYFCIPPFVRLNVDILPMSVSNFIYIAKFCSIYSYVPVFVSVPLHNLFLDNLSQLFFAYVYFQSIQCSLYYLSVVLLLSIQTIQSLSSNRLLVVSMHWPLGN